MTSKVGWPGHSGMRGKRSRASRCMRPVRTSDSNPRTSSGALAARTRDNAGASSACADLARPRQVGADAVERVLELARRPLARRAAALHPPDDQRHHRLQEGERVGRLHEVGLRPAAVLVHAHEAGDLARQVLGRAPLDQAGRDHVRAAVLVPAVVLGRVPVARRVPGRARRRGRRARRRAWRRRSAPPRTRSGSSSSSQSSVRSRWRACGCTSAIHSWARSSIMS